LVCIPFGMHLVYNVFINFMTMVDVPIKTHLAPTMVYTHLKTHIVFHVFIETLAMVYVFCFNMPILNYGLHLFWNALNPLCSYWNLHYNHSNEIGTNYGSHSFWNAHGPNLLAHDNIFNVFFKTQAKIHNSF
jgi:hypothetical protein